MIIENRSHVQFRGVTCTRTFDYYATAAGCVKCRTTYTPAARNLRHLRGHETCQLLNLVLLGSVSDAMAFLGVQLDTPEGSELFAALASSTLRADDDASCIAELLNA